MRARVAAWALASVCAQAGAADGRILVHAVDTARERLVVFQSDEHGRPYRSFERVAAAAGKQGATLTFAMNGGMYHADGGPVGLLVVDGRQLAPLNRQTGTGNFFMQPNGVFALTGTGPRVVAAAAYPAIARDVVLATQSGPMLVKDGVINPRFSTTSQSRYIRNGVCAAGKVAYFAISTQPVTFHEFARYFRDELHCRDALYLDGAVSSLYLRQGRRLGTGTGLGPIIATVR